MPPSLFPTAPEAPEARCRGIAVFGSSEPTADDPAYATARELGTLLAQAGHTVVTGGYGGVMEAASRGAYEAGGRTLGVSTAIFDDRRPNAWLTEIVPTTDLYQRTRELIERSRGYVVLPGKAGTLAELAWIWALNRAGCLPHPPVVLLGQFWPSVIELLEKNTMLDSGQLECTQLAESPVEAVRLLALRLDVVEG